MRSWETSKYLVATIFLSIFLSACGQSEEDRRIAADIEASNAKYEACRQVIEQVAEIDSERSSSNQAKEINKLQATMFTAKIKELYRLSLITQEDWDLFNFVTTSSPFNVPRDGKENVVGRDSEVSKKIEKYFDAKLKLNAIVERWINKELITPYYFKEVIAKGEELARHKSPRNDLILQNKECFSEMDISMAESLRNLKVSSNWGNRKTAAELLEVYN